MSSEPSTKKPLLYYGINSEGMGHATRSLPVLLRLQRHFEVHVFCGARARAYLERHVPNVHEIYYIPLVYENNRMMVKETFIRSFKKFPTVLRDAGWLFVRMLRERPIAVITDYEFLTTWIGEFTRRKIICLDNNHASRFADLPEPETAEEAEERKVVVRATIWNVPFAERFLVSTFWQPGLRPGVNADQVRFVPCAVRDIVIARKGKVRDDGAVVVYQTSSTNVALPDVLRDATHRSQLRFSVFGSGQAPHDEIDGRLSFKEFSEDGFLDELAAAPFVIINGGHSTIVECLTLGKAILAEPVQAQYEQKANGVGLERLGIGQSVERLTADVILAFADRAPAYRARAAEHASVVDNDGLVRILEETIAELTGFNP